MILVQKEQLENIKRIAISGLRGCKPSRFSFKYHYSDDNWNKRLNDFQQIIDILDTLNYESTMSKKVD